MKLPENYKRNIEILLKEEAVAFFLEMEKPAVTSLRVNPLKVNREKLLRDFTIPLKPVAWEAMGFYYPNDYRLGAHPYHLAGAFYIQDASAMAVGQVANVKAHEKVLDLCGAPGGKTTHLAALMNNEGLIVSNEIDYKRSKILSSNVERLGIKNTIVLNETPAQLEKEFPHYFDVIVLDAPCSGEGMFRKDETALAMWNENNVKKCVLNQRKLLASANKMLKKGGRIVYSTCTFSELENEANIKWFSQEYPYYEIQETALSKYFSPGIDLENNCLKLKDTLRLWPHKIKGEGHYIAVLKKTAGSISQLKLKKDKNNIKNIQNYYEFMKDYKLPNLDGTLFLDKEDLYLLPMALDLKNLKAIRPGLKLGKLDSNYFHPSHSLAQFLKEDEFSLTYNLSLNDELLRKYFLGETFNLDVKDGWYLILVDHISIGFMKATKGRLNNHFPKGLRQKIWFK